MSDTNYKAILESVLFTMGESVALGKLAAAVELEPQQTKVYLDSTGR